MACGQSVDQKTSGDFTSEVDIEETQTDITKEENSASDNPIFEEKKEKTDKDESSNQTAILPELKVHYIDVGQADATLFQYGDHNILFDAGDWRGNEVVNYLQSQGVSKLDLVIGSHPDADHIGQLGDVINSFEVTEVWLSGNESTSNTFQLALEAIYNHGTNYIEPRSGEEYDIGPMNLKVLYPLSITGKSNEESISVLFTYGEVTFLFTGDADRNAEKRMMNSGIELDANILQLGHHGSSTSSDPSFINAVSPEVAIYSAGADNSYGHPHQEVVLLISNADIELYGTDVHGTIIVTTDGFNYSIKTKNNGTVTPKSTSISNSNGGTNSKSNSNSSDSTNTDSKVNSSCVNINTASVEEVQSIIHVGPERAQDLINLRPFTSVKDLTRIKGIGDARMRDIEAQGIACVN